ncbi:MAG: cytochrome c oxidase subunit II [Chloroflexi bacterium]|nr:cytochrome c oxidase subunit II [Chloroflexota bacterium]
MSTQQRRAYERVRGGRSFGAGAKAAVLGLVLAIAGFAFTVRLGRAETSVLDPAGPRAARIAELWWVMFALGIAVFVVVMGLLLVAIFRGKRGSDTEERGPFTGTGFVALGGAVIPFLILMIVFGATLWTLIALAEPEGPPGLTIEVAGHQFWWEVRYPDQDVVTANEIHIPTGQPVELKLIGADVIHSLWVPQLSGKLDLIPGKTNTLWLEADEPGEYRGQCAEFCGIQHAHMAFLVIAQPPNEFAEWLDAQREPSDEPAPDSVVERGEQIFLGSACVYCHTVRGTNASGELGPDLTHLASRRTLAAGTLENNLGNLAGWIVDPQSIKPGNKMPATNLGSEELQDLLAYLMSLR